MMLTLELYEDTCQTLHYFAVEQSIPSASVNHSIVLSTVTSDGTNPNRIVVDLICFTNMNHLKNT